MIEYLHMLNKKQTLKVLKFFAQQINDWTLLNCANTNDTNTVDIRSYDVACLCKEYATLLEKTHQFHSDTDDEMYCITAKDVANALDNLDTEFRDCVEEELVRAKLIF